MSILAKLAKQTGREVKVNHKPLHDYLKNRFPNVTEQNINNIVYHMNTSIPQANVSTYLVHLNIRVVRSTPYEVFVCHCLGDDKICDKHDWFTCNLYAEELT